MPQPSTLGANDLLIKISHVGFNVGVMVFMQLLPHPTSNPWVPEFEFSGTIVAIGSAVESADGPFQIGDDVFGAQRIDYYFRNGGVLAEYIVIPASMVLKKPKQINFAEAAGLSGIGCTAVQACDVANLKTGDRVFINGGSGGVGTMVVQVAKSIVGESGTVVATCSGLNLELVKKLGADEVSFLLHQSSCTCKRYALMFSGHRLHAS